MAVELRWGVLCDYATQGQGGKPIALHIFENFFRPAGTGAQAPLPTFNFIGRLECSIGDGTNHAIEARILDGGGQPRAVFQLPEQQFIPQGPGLPLTGGIMIQIQGLKLPEAGDYEFELRVKQRRIAVVDFRVLDITPA